MRLVTEANHVWASVVASDQVPLGDLERVYGGRWLTAVRDQVVAMRGRGQYRIARLLTPVVITNIRPLDSTGQRLEAEAKEDWDDHLFNRDGSPAGDIPGQVTQTYIFEQRNGRWLIVESHVVRN